MLLLVGTEAKELPKTHSHIGMDVELKDFIIFADGPSIKSEVFSVIRRESGVSSNLKQVLQKQ
ncbi:hypothetical protein BHL35_00240 [Bacillus cereus]|nr:hypothetical protein BHL35_00240 [Bacillus cereus]